MDRFNLLDCTLRDGGYITKWRFEDHVTRDILHGLVDAGMDFIECGYINPERINYPAIQHADFANLQANTTQFNSINAIDAYLPESRNNSVMLAMADVLQVKPQHITPCTSKSIDGIRVVFYKHQVEDALSLCRAVKDAGYQLFVQPMVTVDYSIAEYTKLARAIAALQPDAVSIVDSFGYMLKEDFRCYYKILDNALTPEVMIGFHSHNNMQLAFITAQDILDYQTSRSLVIDASLYGMGRGAGNLNTELIANYYNMELGEKYDILAIMDLIGKYIMPIAKEKEWGYSPYMFLTGLYHCHPNFACYLLEEHDVTVTDFEKYLQFIPPEMKTKCRKPYVLDLYAAFQKEKKND